MLVSVIVPVYNAEDYIAECIESILHQDYQEVELVLVNDGSTDGSLAVCRRYESERVRVIDKPNEGVSVARNVGMQASKGSLLTFVDSDDRLPTDSVSVMVKAMKDSGADYVCGSYFMDFDGRLVKHSQRLAPGDYFSESLLDGFIDDGTLSGFLLGSASFGLYKRMVIEEHKIEFDKRIKMNEDGVFNLEYILNTKKIRIIPNVVYYYTQRSDSVSKTNRIPDDLNKTIREHVESLDWDYAKYHLDRQMKTRDVSIALWDMIIFPRKINFVSGCRYIRNLVSSEKVREGVKFLNFSAMPAYKRLYAYLIKWRMSVLLCFIIKYVQPLVMGRMKR